MERARRRSYFATRPASEVGRAMMERLKPLLADEQHTNIEEMRNAYCHVYGRDVGYGITSGVTRGGERGELSLLRINAVTADARAKHALVTAADLTWKPQARNGSSSAARATPLATDVLVDEWKDNRLSVAALQWAEWTIYFSESFVFTEWSRSAGPLLAVLDGRPIHQGAIVYHSVPAWDVWRDPASKSYRAGQWRFVRLWRNRFDVVKETPRLLDGRDGAAAEDAILGACESPGDVGVTDGDRYRLADSELVPVWHFFHEPTSVLPMGRYVSFVSDNVVLRDEPLRGPNATYEGCPLYRLAEREMVDSPFAWAPYWDALGGQEVADAIDTGLATRATMMGAPIFALEKGSDMSPEKLGGGGRALYYPRGAKPPSEVAPPKVPGELLEYRRDIRQENRQIQNLNDAAMGQQKGSELNAQASALLASMAVQQAAPFQKAWTAALGELGTGVLKLLAKHVKEPRELRSTRDGARHEATSYTGADLLDIEGVTVEVGNALEQTAQGRMALADLYFERGWAPTPEKYSQVLTTGRTDSLTKRDSAELTLVQWEHEQLSKGIAPPVHYAQNHALHFRENSAPLMDPASLENPDVLAATEAHLDEHYLQMFGVPRAMDPLRGMRERWMLGLPFGPGQEMPMAPAAPPGAPAAAGAPPAPGPAPVAAPPALAEVPAPEMPANPLTGEQFNPVDGGGVAAPPH